MPDKPTGFVRQETIMKAMAVILFALVSGMVGMIINDYLGMKRDIRAIMKNQTSAEKQAAKDSAQWGRISKNMDEINVLKNIHALPVPVSPLRPE